MKKIVATALIVLASTGVMAKTATKTMQPSQQPSPWSIEGGSDMGYVYLTDISISTISLKPRAVILYVSPYKTASVDPFGGVQPLSPAVDPIHVDCNGVPTTVNPGSATVCKINMASNNSLSWNLDTSYNHNGSEGYTIAMY